MSRLAAFSLLATAAFDWPLPWLDRAGTAALGLAFLALAVGAPFAGVRRSFRAPRGPAALDATSELDSILRDLPERVAAYTDDDGR